MPYPLAAAHGHGVNVPFFPNLLGALHQWYKADAGTTLSQTAYAGAGVVSQTGTTLTGIGSAFTTEIFVGDLITAIGISETVVSIASDTSLTLSGSLSSGAGLTYTITPVAGVSDQVGTWADQSGAANDQTQATAAKKPRKIPNSKNGLPAIHGHTQCTTGTVTASTAWSIFIVCKCPIHLSNGRNWCYGNSNIFTIYDNGTGFGSYIQSGDPGGVSANWSIVTLVVSGSTGNAYYNGGNAVAISGMPDLSAVTNHALYGGYNGVGIVDNPSNTLIGEYIAYRSALSTPNVVAVRDYLNARWAVY